MADFQIVIAGFGGQGLLFSGKVLAYAGLLEGRELSWLPSYGPEMRGGTANCNVILSDTPVGSPIVQHPNVLMVMNNPSLDKYEDTVAPGSKIFVDSTLIGRKVRRTDVEAYYIPATGLAGEMGVPTLANMLLLGALVEKTFEGSLPAFVAAFARKTKLSQSEVDQLRAMIDGFEEAQK